MMPHRRELVVWPQRQQPGERPGVDFRPLTPEQQRARRDAANARKPRAVRLSFNCGHSARECIGCCILEDDRLAKFCCDGGYTIAIPMPGQVTEQQLAAEAAEFQRRRLGPYRRRA
jgi:hypothetical protein